MMASLAHMHPFESARRFKCNACRDTGKVADVFQYLRPCSRCDAEGFIRWNKERTSAEQIAAITGNDRGAS